MCISDLVPIIPSLWGVGEWGEGSIRMVRWSHRLTRYRHRLTATYDTHRTMNPRHSSTWTETRGPSSKAAFPIAREQVSAGGSSTTPAACTTLRRAEASSSPGPSHRLGVHMLCEVEAPRMLWPKVQNSHSLSVIRIHVNELRC